MDAHKIEALKDLIKEKAIVVDINGIILSSGEKSQYYYDLKKVMFDPVGINLIADLMFEEITLKGAKSVGGLEIGAIPITTAILAKSEKEHPLDGFVVRKHAKDHGLKYSVEGNLKPPVVIVDDVLTSGESLKKAIDEVMKSENVSVRYVFCILDRENENNVLKHRHYPYTSLCKHSDFKPFIDAEIEKQKDQKIRA
ncbi:MAG TPA: phosphoribosyltransferase family protein [Candidatus Nitrosopolaris sp.]|nr:phosphoribosyltransferase family protein [Candidatus Nitrosopolaris sp.]